MNFSKYAAVAALAVFLGFLYLIFQVEYKYQLNHVVRDGDSYFWMQDYPTTRHGVCAEVEVEDHVGWSIDSKESGQIWAVDKPDTKSKSDGMSAGPTAQYTFNTPAEAKAWAEHLCPTK